MLLFLKFCICSVYGQIILKEREGKKGKPSTEQESSGQEEHGEECLHFTDDLPREPASQEGEYYSLITSEKHSCTHYFFHQDTFSHCGLWSVWQKAVLVCPVMRPSPRPVRTLHTASPQYPRVPLPALELGVPWLQTPSPRSTADVSESKYRSLSTWIKKGWTGSDFLQESLALKSVKNAQRGKKKWFANSFPTQKSQSPDCEKRTLNVKGCF